MREAELPFVNSQKGKKKRSFSIFTLQDTQGLDLTLHIPPEEQIKLSTSPLVSVTQATPYKSVPLCPMDLLGVSSVLARTSTSTHSSFLSLGDRNCFALLWEALYDLIPLLFSGVAPSTVLSPFSASCSTAHRISFWLPCLIMMSM